MKKMMMIMAVVLAAAVSQAASVQWSTGAIKVPNGDGSFGANAGATTGIYLATVAFYLNNGGVAGSLIAGITGNTDNSTSALSVLNGTTAGYNFVANTKYWTQVIVTTTDGKWKMESLVASFTVPGTGNAIPNFLTGANFDVVSNKMPAKWTPVPEPTSMALLALGAAAVGLRRKFRK